ncbi:hypothetical protein IMSHALPRED_010374 [Imshaugia aleurites]|uniref:Uncharacterized protein n=1 Tax=Imshaugia aleurites TaxID=172621 RepID=A0A8H3G3F3_9LECA|nr:hypothetical protein IMSHALPRED_010374 [Imshaugia aleurites]
MDQGTQTHPDLTHSRDPSSTCSNDKSLDTQAITKTERPINPSFLLTTNLFSEEKLPLVKKAIQETLVQFNIEKQRHDSQEIEAGRRAMHTVSRHPTHQESPPTYIKAWILTKLINHPSTELTFASIRSEAINVLI